MCEEYSPENMIIPSGLRRCKSQNPDTFCTSNIDLSNSSNRQGHQELALKRSRMKFHRRFLILKENLKINKFLRKTQIDSLLKKTKTKVCKAIHKAMEKCLKIKLERLPQDFITNIKIDSNKKLLNKKIAQIYEDFKLLPSLSEVEEKGIICENKKKQFLEFCNLTWKEACKAYIGSTLFIKDIQAIQLKEGYALAMLFKFMGRIFPTYFDFSKGNKSSKINFRTKLTKFAKSQGLKRKELFKISK
jgi:hypothetical protein